MPLLFPPHTLPRWLVWLAAALVLAACQRAPEPPAYRYDDRDLWKALPTLQVNAGNDVLKEIGRAHV